MGRAFNHYFLPNASGTNLLVSNCNVISEAQTICKSNVNSKFETGNVFEIGFIVSLSFCNQGYGILEMVI